MLLLIRRFTRNLLGPMGETSWLDGVAQLGFSTFIRSEFVASISENREQFADWLDLISPNHRTYESIELVQALVAQARRMGLTQGGSPLRMDDANVVIDHPSLALRLDYLLNVAPVGGGEAGNVRGEVFSALVQERIDLSPWRPDDATREMLGKHRARAGGEQDIDAIGSNEGRLLLVEVKSWVRSAEYDMGGPVVSRLSERVERAMRLQVARFEELRAGPSNRGLDVSKWDMVDSVVCTPGPLLVRGASEFASAQAGMSLYCTIEEMDIALNS